MQPFLRIVNTLTAGRSSGWLNADPIPGNYAWNVDNALALNLTWNVFDGGAARAQIRVPADEDDLAGGRDRIRRQALFGQHAEGDGVDMDLA